MSANIGEGKYVISVDNSGAISQLGQFEQKAKSTGQGVKDSFLLGASGALNLAGGLRGLYGQFDQLEKVQLRIKKTNLEVSRAQEELNKLTVDGKEGTLDYEQALQRLEIAKEKNKQANDDLFKGNLDVALSIGQIAVGIPAAIKALEGLSAVKKVLTATTWAETFAFLANPLFAIPTAAAIATAVGLVATNTWGLRDALFGTTEAVEANTDAMKVYNGELSSYENTARSAGSTTRDLNDQMDRTINNLKKNEISDELNRVKAEMVEGVFIMGSLEQVYNNFKAAGVEGFVRELQKDLRDVKELGSSIGLNLGVDFSDVLHERNFTARGMTSAQAKILSGLSGNVSNYFRDIVANARNGLNGLSFTKSLHGNLGFLGGITQAQTASLINGGKTGSSKARSGSSKARGGKFGGTKGPLPEAYETRLGMIVGNVFSIGSADRATGQILEQQNRIRGNQIIELLMSEGVGVPSAEIMNPSSYKGRTQYMANPNFSAQLNAAIAEANRRRSERIEKERQRVLGLSQASGLSESEVVAYESTSQGIDDLNGIIDFRKRIALASSGT